MAQEVITGLTGSITLPNSGDQYISSVSLNVGSELLDVSRYGGNGWRTRVAGLRDLAGSCVAFMSKGSTGTSPVDLDGDTGTMTITFDTGCYISFAAIISGVSIVGEYQGLNIVSFSFAKNDDNAPNTAWATS